MYTWFRNRPNIYSYRIKCMMYRKSYQLSGYRILDNNPVLTQHINILYSFPAYFEVPLKVWQVPNLNFEKSLVIYIYIFFEDWYYCVNTDLLQKIKRGYTFLCSGYSKALAKHFRIIHINLNLNAFISQMGSNMFLLTLL